MMKYQYFNQFSLTNELTNTLTKIISIMENKEYFYKIINITIPEHEGLIFHSPLDQYQSFGGGLKALSGAQRSAIAKEEGWYTEDIIEKYAKKY